MEEYFSIDSHFSIDSMKTIENLRPNISYSRKYEAEFVSNISLDTPVTTISPNWLPLTTLEDEFKFNERYRQNIRELSFKYCGWKKIRGDGNCYYRSVISTYITKIFNFNQNPNRIYELILILNQMTQTEMEPDFKSSIENVKNILTELYQKFTGDLEGKVRAFKEICVLLQDVEFDLNLVRTSRMISYLVFSSPAGDSIRPFLTEEEIESILYRILQMGTEAEGVELSLCPLALKILVNQVNIFDKIVYNTFPVDLEGDVKEQEKVVIDIICKSRGHYDALYSIKDLEEDDYNIGSMKYCVDEGVNLN